VINTGNGGGSGNGKPVLRRDSGSPKMLLKKSDVAPGRTNPEPDAT
jgi:hypothetical protein